MPQIFCVSHVHGQGLRIQVDFIQCMHKVYNLYIYIHIYTECIYKVHVVPYTW